MKIGRFGGDEFIFLLPQTSEAIAISVLNRINAALKLLEIKADDGSKVGVSLSAGIYCLENGFSADLETLIRKADQALYQTKAASRNSDGILFYSTPAGDPVKI